MIKNPLAWCVWAIAALAAAFMERNPFLQALLLLVLINVWVRYGRTRRLSAKIGLTLAIIPIIFSVAFSRFGTHVLVTLPAIPLIGGRWTWDALMFGASAGAALLLTVAVFAIVQSTVRSADLLPLLPRPLYRAGTAVALSIAFVPKTVQSFHAIREARRLRAQRTGWRSVRAVLVPLLLTTLEQALQYGESLDARGYGNRKRSRYRPLEWSLADGVNLLAASVSLALVATTPIATWDPYTNIVPLSPPIAAIIAIVLLAVPALSIALAQEKHAANHA